LQENIKNYIKKKFSKIKYKKLFLNFGTIGLKALESNFISSFQLKSLNFILSKKFKRKGKIWYNFSLNIPVTSKPVEVRMGKGKGSLAFWEAQVDAGQILLELSTNKEIAQEALALVYAKSPIPLLFVEKEEKTFQ